MTVDFVATCLPSTNTSAAPTTPLTISVAVWPAARLAVKSVRYHHGTLNLATLTGPLELVKPKHLRMLSEKKTLGQPPFCSSASISVPGAPASSGVTDSQPDVLKPGVEICCPVCVAVALVSTFQPPVPRVIGAAGLAAGVPAVIAARADAAVTSASAAPASASSRRGTCLRRAGSVIGSLLDDKGCFDGRRIRRTIRTAS